MPKKRSKEEDISGLKHNVPFKSLSNSNSSSPIFFMSKKPFGFSQKNLPVGDLFLRSRTIKMERTYKKA